MREGLLGALIQGDKVVWGLLAALWIITTILVVFRRSSYGRGAPSTPLRVFSLLAATSITSLSALPLTGALALPRIRWKTVQAPDLCAPAGDTWRRLRGPAVQVNDRGTSDVAVPTVLQVDGQERWVLVGLLSGRTIEGLPPAPDAPLAAGALRICRTDTESCRPWPSSWPDPSRPIGTGELIWTKDSPTTALAYDPETGYYLQSLAGVSEAEGLLGSGGPPPGVLDLAGRITNAPPREGTSVLFLLRSVTEERLRAVRVVSVATPTGKSFHLQRSDMSLTTGPSLTRWFARPVLLTTSLAFPLGAVVYLYVVLSSRRRRERTSAPSISQRSSGRLDALSAIATLAAGVAAGAPAAVAIASLWASR